MNHPLPHPDELEQLLAAIRGSANYRNISPDLIRRIGTRELAVRSNLKEAIKATKTKLHQVAGAYVERTQYERWFHDIEATSDPEALRVACRTAMAGHASSRERLGIIERFYNELFTHLGNISSVLDLACGLNPLALPWMPLSISAYYACDLDAELIRFIDSFLKSRGVGGGAEVCDLLAGPPPVVTDVAFLFKTMPVLDQLQRDGGLEVLRSIAAAQIVVSYPTRSLGGRGKGFGQTYTEKFTAMAQHEGWQYEQLEFPGELVFIIRRGTA
jgi:16S rRNA (guanine(1405)-N(7))-methyltransferase